MKAAAARFWYRHLQHIATIIDGLNTDGDPMYQAGNEGIRMIAREMCAHTEDITDTQSMQPVTVKVFTVGEGDCGS